MPRIEIFAKIQVRYAVKAWLHCASKRVYILRLFGVCLICRNILDYGHRPKEKQNIRTATYHKHFNINYYCINK